MDREKTGIVKLSNFSEESYEAFCRGFAYAEAGEVEKAVSAYTVAAKLGAVDAQLNLATLLDDHASPRRPVEAVYWYKRALRGGSDSAAWNLAMHYAGCGNYRWYLHWLHVANDMGDADATEELLTREWWEKRRAQRQSGLAPQ